MGSNDVLLFIDGMLQSVATFLWTPPIKYLCCAVIMTFIVRIIYILMGKEV